MILVDYSQVTISNIMMQYKTFGSLDEGMIRHMILNSIRAYRKKFSDKYGELVICCDDRHYWRKDLYPEYKGHRKKDQANDDFDWNTLFKHLNTIKDELREFFPYQVIQAETAEADDIIGTLCHQFGSQLGGDPILILSGDKDFKQLQVYSNVDQYAPVQKKWIKEPNAAMFLKEHILIGDKGDGIPNFLSDDKCLIEGRRQKPLGAKKISKWVNETPEDFCDENMLRGYKRNEQLVDLNFIPAVVRDDILSKYNDDVSVGRSKLFNYFVSHKLKNLMQSLSDF